MTRILRAASARLAEQVRLLPTTFYTAAVHAAFPTIHDDRSACVCASDLNSSPLAEALWPALSHVTSLRMTGLKAMSTEDASSLGSQLAKLSCIQKLDLSRILIGADGAKALGPHIARLTSIQHLDLEFTEMGSAGVKSLGPHLRHLKSMQLLALQSNTIGDVGARSLGPHLAQLTSITYLGLNETTAFRLKNKRRNYLTCRTCSTIVKHSKNTDM